MDNYIDIPWNSKFFSMLDACLSYWQMHIWENNWPKQSVCLYTGTQQYIHIPFSYINASFSIRLASNIVY